MPGKHLLIETESGDVDGAGSEPDGEGTVQIAESGSPLLFSAKQLSIISGRCEDDKPWVRVPW